MADQLNAINMNEKEELDAFRGQYSSLNIQRSQFFDQVDLQKEKLRNQMDQVQQTMERSKELVERERQMQEDLRAQIPDIK